MLLFLLQPNSAGSSAWAKGTGYGGASAYYGSHSDHAMNPEEQKSRKEAAQRQQEVDKYLQRGITHIRRCLEQTTGKQSLPLSVRMSGHATTVEIW